MIVIYYFLSNSLAVNINALYISWIVPGEEDMIMRE